MTAADSADEGLTENELLALWEKYAVHGGPQGSFMLANGFRQAVRQSHRATPAPVPSAEELSAEEIDEIFNSTLAAQGLLTCDPDVFHKLCAQAKHAMPGGAGADRLLNGLEELYRTCPHAIMTFNDDSDDERAPVGYSITIDGCEPAEYVGTTLRQAISAALDPDKSYASPIGAGERETIEPWVSVDERLPDPDTWLVSVNTDDGQFVYTMELNDQKQWIYEGEPTFCHSYYIEVTHWKPLPAPAISATGGDNETT